MSANKGGYAGTLLARAREELEGLEAARGELLARISLLEPVGHRSRRQILADPRMSEDLVDAVLAQPAQALTPAELGALVSRPFRASYAHPARRTLRHLKEQLDARGYRALDYDRVRQAVVVVASASGWPGVVRAKVLLEEGQFRPLVLQHLTELASQDRHVALMLGMHSDDRTWAQGASTFAAASALREALRDVPWFTVGAVCTVGRRDLDDETALRDRLAALDPIEVTLPVAARLGPLRSRTWEACLEQIDVLESLVAGVTASPLPAKP